MQALGRRNESSHGFVVRGYTFGTRFARKIGGTKLTDRDIGREPLADKTVVVEQTQKLRLRVAGVAGIAAQLAIWRDEIARQTEDRRDEEAVLPSETQERGDVADERRIRRDDVTKQELAVALQQPVKELQRVDELAPVEILHDGVDDDQIDRSRKNGAEFSVVEDADFGIAGVMRKQPAARAIGAVVEQQRPAGLRQVVGGKRFP